MVRDRVRVVSGSCVAGVAQAMQVGNQLCFLVVPACALSHAETSAVQAQLNNIAEMHPGGTCCAVVRPSPAC